MQYQRHHYENEPPRCSNTATALIRQPHLRMENLMTVNTTPDTYEGQLAARAAELLGELGTDGRLELLAVMDADDMRTSLAFILSRYPQVFDFALVRDRALVDRLSARLDEGQDDDEEPYCSVCQASIGIFQAHGEAWIHYRGEGTAASPVELYDAGHEPAIAWRPAGAR
jgi:hypothetical protein